MSKFEGLRPLYSCQCGCGQIPKISRSDDSRGAYLAGEQRRFLPGHFARVPARMNHFPSRYEMDAETGCWNWTGAKMTSGYGTVLRGGRQIYAHRLSYQNSKGPIPTGLQIDHLCRNKTCVNPEHLEAVTAAVNNARSNSASAINARKTHCNRGHEFDAENTLLNSAGRRCRICTYAKNNAYYARRRARA